MLRLLSYKEVFVSVEQEGEFNKMLKELSTMKQSLDRLSAIVLDKISVENTIDQDPKSLK